MDSGVGTVLHKARNRRKIDLSEVEAATRIRFRFLRAIEDEEWDVLPGGVYTRGFIRTYASFLGLDGERLVEDYKGEVEPWQRPPAEQLQAQDRGAASSGRSSVVLAGLVVTAVIAVAVLAIVAIPGGGDDGPVAQPGPDSAKPGKTKEKAPPAAPRPGVTIRVAATAEVWTCLLDAKGKAMVNGLILGAGAEAGPFHSGSFTVSFGNGEVKMLIDGREAEIPATSSPIGYAIDPAGRLTELDEAERPTCT